MCIYGPIWFTYEWPYGERKKTQIKFLLNFTLSYFQKDNIHVNDFCSIDIKILYPFQSWIILPNKNIFKYKR